MITLRDLFDVTPTITRAIIIARGEDLLLLHHFWLGENCDREHLPMGMVPEWTRGRLTMSDRAINVHGCEKKNRQPEIGWGLDSEAVPKQILDAEVTHLGMRCLNGIKYEVHADIVMPVMHVEMLKSHYEEAKSDG